MKSNLRKIAEIIGIKDEEVIEKDIYFGWSTQDFKNNHIPDRFLEFIELEISDFDIANKNSTLHAIDQYFFERTKRLDNNKKIKGHLHD